MKLKLILVTFLTSFLGFSQDYSFEWGQQMKSKTSIFDIYKIDGNSFYARSFGKGRNAVILYYDNLTQASKTIYKPVVNRKPTMMEGTFEISGKIYTFTSQDNEDKTKKTLYVHEFRKSAEPIDIEGKEVTSFEFDSKNKRRSGYTLIASEDMKKLCVSYYSNPRKKKDAEKGKYGYFILNEDLQIESEGSFDDILEEAGESISEYKLSNQGALFLVTSVAKKDEPTTMKFYKVTGDEINSLELNLGEKYTNQISIAIDKDENFVVSGFYGVRAVKGQTKGTGVRGVFYTVMDPETQEILSSGYNEFDDAFIMEGLSARQKAKTEKRKDKKGIEPSLYNFKMRHFSHTNDGGSFGIAEEYYVVVTTYRDPKTGATTTTYTYYYNDLIVFKLDAAGEMVWKKKIQKTQISTNDGGYLSSFVMKQVGEKVYLLFNDNMRNYDPVTKKFNNSEMPSAMSFSKKNNAIALVQIDLNEGDVTREAMGSKKELGAILIPKVCFPDKDNASILLYTRLGKKEMVGRINFKD